MVWEALQRVSKISPIHYSTLCLSPSGLRSILGVGLRGGQEAIQFSLPRLPHTFPSMAVQWVVSQSQVLSS